MMRSTFDLTGKNEILIIVKCGLLRQIGVLNKSASYQLEAANSL